MPYDFVDRRRCGDRRNGHRAELFDPHTLPCEPLPRPAADHPRSGYPLTIGSITTIGAFAGLLFTDSQLLRDFGLFASLTLVGTTLFSLVLLPHLIRKEKRGGGSAVLERVERLTGMRPDRNRPLVAAILLLTFICLFFFNRIGFDSDMMHLNYDPPRLPPRSSG